MSNRTFTVFITVIGILLSVIYLTSANSLKKPQYTQRAFKLHSGVPCTLILGKGVCGWLTCDYSKPWEKFKDETEK